MGIGTWMTLINQFHEYIQGSWTILFSHPDDFVSVPPLDVFRKRADSQTPVCTTELSAVALSYADFQSRGVKVGYLQ